MAGISRLEAVFTYEPPPGLLDPTNRRLLAELAADPRISMSALGRRLGMSAPAVTERVRRLEEGGIIRGYRIEVDPAALGLPLTAFVRVKPNPGRLAAVADLARAIPEVVECHRVTGEDCFVLKVHLPAIEQLDRLLDRFLVHGTTTTSLVQSSPISPRTPPLPWPDDAAGNRGTD